MSFVIDPQSVSFTKIKADLVSYIQAKPDALSWQDFYESSAGTVVVELIAGLSVFEQYNTIVQRRETFLQYATALSSAKAIASNLGYSARRGSNHKFNLTVTPSTTVALKKYDQIGLYNSKTVRVSTDVNLQAGVSIVVPCVLGELLTESLTYAGAGIAVMHFTIAGISDDVRLYLDATAIAFSTKILDLANNQYVLISNVQGSVNVSYLNTDSTDPLYYSTGTVLKVEGIILDSTLVVLADVVFDYGTITSSSTITNPTSFESVQEIQQNAPLYHETQVLLRSRNDYKKLIKVLDPTMLDVNGRDVSPLVVDLTYIKNDESILTAGQKTSLITSLNPYRPFGVHPPTMSDPAVRATNIDVTVALLSGTVISGSTVETDIRKEWDKFEFKLGQVLDFTEMEHLGEKAATYARTIRISITNGVPTTLLWNEYYKFTYNVILA